MPSGAVAATAMRARPDRDEVPGGATRITSAGVIVGERPLTAGTWSAASADALAGPGRVSHGNTSIGSNPTIDRFSTSLAELPAIIVRRSARSGSKARFFELSTPGTRLTRPWGRAGPPLTCPPFKAGANDHAGTGNPGRLSCSQAPSGRGRMAPWTSSAARPVPSNPGQLLTRRPAGGECRFVRLWCGYRDTRAR
jgi:hypothetical protein